MSQRTGLGKKLLLLFGTIGFLWVLLFAGLRVALRAHGVEDLAVRYENEIEMWADDSVLGYRNKSDFSATVYGGLPVRTNAQGHRGSVSTPAQKSPNTVRIIATGDSVMWGTGVKDVDSLPSQLRQWLNSQDRSSGNGESPPDSPRNNPAPRYEVINAGVVGYSTLQQALQLERDLLPLQPDIVLVNYCENDFLPSEDPFHNVREVCVRYLKQLPEHGDLNDLERQEAESLIETFQTADRVWDALKATGRPVTRRRFRLLVELPMIRMAQACADAGARLVYLFIPPRTTTESYRATRASLQALLGEHGAVGLDLGDVVQGLEMTKPAFQRESIDAPMWQSVPGGRELQALLFQRAYQRVHREQDYMDGLHLSRRGNRLVAEAVGSALLASE